MFAPDVEMMHVVNHCEGKPVTDKRNVLQESARIARGDVTDLDKLDVGAFDALIIPGDQTAAAKTRPQHEREIYKREMNVRLRSVIISACCSFDVCCFIISLLSFQLTSLISV